ncbi:MAG: TraB/GumN family protein [Methylococcales bacterium]|jgi:uncharacterized protein|nr:TraB/GumN family protein [Methylococcales bacterium]MBT7445643.1 TraB/GumN family protein [Methylococcales bacterium]
MRWFGLLLCVVSFSSAADGFVWEVSKGAETMYIGGTIHVLSKGDYPLPKSYDKAYNNAEVTAFETDIDALHSLAFQSKMLGALYFKNSSANTLKKSLSTKAYSALSQYFKSRGMNINDLKKSKPQMVYVMMVQVEMMRIGMTLAGVDEHFNERRKKDKKSAAFLETLDQQLDFIVNMGKGHESELILQSLEEMSEMKEMMGKLKAAWRSGDRAKLAEVALEDMQKDYPELYQSLLVKRNNAWMPQLEAMLTTPEVEFVLVGALHLVGEEGVLSKLEAKGYTVKHLD